MQVHLSNNKIDARVLREHTDGHAFITVFSSQKGILLEYVLARPGRRLLCARVRHVDEMRPHIATHAGLKWENEAWRAWV